MNLGAQARQIQAAASEEIDHFRDRLTEAGISWSEPKLDEANERGYTAEISIYWYRNGDIFDVFEFLVFREGSCVAAEQEVREWVCANVTELLTAVQRDSR